MDNNLKPEEKARIKIDKQLKRAGWNIVAREEYVPNEASAVEEALMKGNTESDYLLFVDNKAIAVLEAKKEDNPLGPEVELQAEGYATHPQEWYALWFNNLIPLVYMANGKKIYFKNMLIENSEYQEISEMHSPKKMLKLIGKESEYGALPRLEKKGLRDCQYDAEINLEQSLRLGVKKNLAELATGSGKTYLACLASYRLLEYTPTQRVLFLVDRNNLARQTESEFSLFDKTEQQKPMNNLYKISRLRKEADLDSDIVISTIQKLFAFLTGQQVLDDDEDAEDEAARKDEESETDDEVTLGEDLKIPPDFFQFIVVDECHRSIYGKWKSVLNYFSDATILGLTATPTPEAIDYFNGNFIKRYSYDESVVDGVNVPDRIYRIATRATEFGGVVEEGTDVIETTRRTGAQKQYKAESSIGYTPMELDRSVTNPDQIRKVLTAYKNAIYTDLYPEREQKWEYIPKTLIFAKDDKHATEIVNMVKEVFGSEFSGGLPASYVQKITYSAGDSNALIRDLRTEKEFRIAVTVTLVATGTDVKPLEVVLFMRDVGSDVLYKQMKGRGCRSIKDDKFREVTPNASTKECFYIVDAVGVTEHEKTLSGGGPVFKKKTLNLMQLLEHLAHGEVSDENLVLLRNYCSTIHNRYENNALFGKHLEFFISEYGFAPRTIANDIQNAFDQGSLIEYEGPSGDNTARLALIAMLINNVEARKKLIEMQKGYIAQVDDEDEVIYAGFSQNDARTYIESFEKYINDNKDSIEALHIISSSKDAIITHKMLVELRDRLLAENRQFGVYRLWKSYQVLDETGQVDEFDVKYNVNALTNLIQLVRYAFKMDQRLTSLIVGYAKRFNLYCGYNRRILTNDQVEVMRQIADYIINDGAISSVELNGINTDLWREGVKSFNAQQLDNEMKILSKFLLRTA